MATASSSVGHCLNCAQCPPSGISRSCLMASSLAVHSSSTTMVGGGVHGHRAHRRQRTALLRHRVRRVVGRGPVACILLVHVGLHDHERRGDRGRGVHRRAVARRRADGDGWPTQAGGAFSLLSVLPGGDGTFSVLRIFCTPCTFSVLRQNGLAFSVPPPYVGGAKLILY